MFCSMTAETLTSILIFKNIFELFIIWAFAVIEVLVVYVVWSVNEKHIILVFFPLTLALSK